jgi:hypothetical protein
MRSPRDQEKGGVANVILGDMQRIAILRLGQVMPITEASAEAVGVARSVAYQ